MKCNHCMKELADGAKFCPYCGKPPAEENPPHHLPIGAGLNNRYIVGNSIGEGGFGITYIGYDTNLDMPVAIKEFYPAGYANRNQTLSNAVTLNYTNQGEYFKNGKENFLREAKNIAKFSSEDGIVDVRDYFTENETAYIVMEYLDGEPLNRYLDKHGKLSAAEAFELFLPLMRSLEKIHSAGIIHRDITPDNIMMLKNGNIKLMDFGSARYFSSVEQKTMSIMLKPGYAPYEQYSVKGNQGPWTDVYGLCATMYKCITGITPPDSLDRCQEDTLQKPSAVGAAITPALENVLMYGLAIYHDNRCQSMGELIKITGQALNNEHVSFPDAGNAAVSRVKAEDDKYKTMFAEDYSAGNTQNFVPRAPQQPNNPPNAQWNQPPVPMPAPQKKTSPALIAALIAATVIVVAAVGVFTFMMIRSDKSDDSQSDKGNAATSASENTSGGQDITATPMTEAPVTVTNVKGKKRADAEKALKAQGLTVTVTEEYSDTVKKGYVVSQTPEANQKTDKGGAVTLYVSKGPATCPYEYQQKLTVDSSKGKATLYIWGDGDWKTQATYNAVVASNGVGTAREGSSVTPKGTFRLGTVLTAQSVTTSLNVCKVTGTTCVVDDTNSPLYNQIMDKSSVPRGTSYDTIGRGLTDGTTYATIYIEHNGNGFSSDNVVRGNGSAIGVRGQYNLSYGGTYGDVDISANDMADLLARLEAAKKPVIEIK